MATKKPINNNYFQELKSLVKYSVNDLTTVSVAAIIVTDKGVFKGVNYENIIPSLSICAERNAIYNAVTHGMREIYEIHLLSSLKNITMCGLCRQLAATFSNDKTTVFVYDAKTGKRNQIKFKILLPHQPIIFAKK